MRRKKKIIRLLFFTFMRMNTSIEITLRKNLKISEKPKLSVVSIRSVLYFIILLGSLNPILEAQVQKLDRDSKIALQQNRAKLQQQLPAERDTIPGISDSL